ncbi:hypothetical protein J6590_001543 [Homalodisca vitripennis]|nr:hypothetical protein J6590_001543 [Homalodisca vitripennis]
MKKWYVRPNLAQKVSKMMRHITSISIKGMCIVMTQGYMSPCSLPKSGQSPADSLQSRDSPQTHQLFALRYTEQTELTADLYEY